MEVEMKTFINDSTDSWLTVRYKKCQHTIYIHSNDLLSSFLSNDSSDCFSNFLAIKERKESDDKNCVYINRFQNSVITVRALLFRFSTPSLKKSYFTDIFLTQLSSNYQYCQQQLSEKPSCEGINNILEAFMGKSKSECKHHFQTGQGRPVEVLHCTSVYKDYWRVQHDNSCIFFATENDALAYCRVRFYDLEGNRLYRRSV